MGCTEAARNRTGGRQELSPSVHMSKFMGCHGIIVGQVELQKFGLNAKHLGSLTDF